jgi:hypothetical protein
MKAILESVYINLDDEDLDEFIQVTRTVGYKYLIIARPDDEHGIYAAWACYSDSELIDISLELSLTHSIDISLLNDSNQFSLN